MQLSIMMFRMLIPRSPVTNTGKIINIGEKSIQVIDKKGVVWNIDITDFFSSIPTAAVAANLMEPPFKFVAEKAKYIALLICYKKQLPTGSPCSPIVSNIVCNSLDKKMQSWVNELNKTDENLQLVFTRYADDITFSSYRNVFNTASFQKELHQRCDR